MVECMSSRRSVASIVQFLTCNPLLENRCCCCRRLRVVLHNHLFHDVHQPHSHHQDHHAHVVCLIVFFHWELSYDPAAVILYYCVVVVLWYKFVSYYGREYNLDKQPLKYYVKNFFNSVSVFSSVFPNPIPINMKKEFFLIRLANQNRQVLKLKVKLSTCKELFLNHKSSCQYSSYKKSSWGISVLGKSLTQYSVRVAGCHGRPMILFHDILESHKVLFTFRPNQGLTCQQTKIKGVGLWWQLIQNK